MSSAISNLTLGRRKSVTQRGRGQADRLCFCTGEAKEGAAAMCSWRCCPAHWHVYAPDLRGHGLSGRVPGHYLIQDFVPDISAFLQGVVRTPAVVVGHSLGGNVGIMLAAQYPHLVRALIV